MQNKVLTKILTKNLYLHLFVDTKKEGFTRALLMDLSKAFYTMNHELFISKLYAYGFSIEALEGLLI